MKIGIDARFYGSLGKGLGRYTQKLIEHLEIIDHTNQYVVFLRQENFDEYQPKQPNFQKVLADYQWYSFSEQFLFPFLLIKYRCDTVHFPHFNVPILYRGKFVVTIHDLILVHFPTQRASTLHPLWYKIKFAGYKMAIWWAIHTSHHIMTVSEYTKQDILKHYRVDQKKITVAYEAIDSFCWHKSKEDAYRILRTYGLTQSDGIDKKYGIIKPYLLYVGNAYPHKNLETLIDVVASDSTSEIVLVLVGKEDYFYSRLKSKVRSLHIHNIIFTGYVPDDELDVLYRCGRAYVFPSLYEGFGLPPLEAMGRGLPVLATDTTSLPEVLGDAALYYNPAEARSLEIMVTRIWSDASLRAALRQKGYLQIQKYSWQTMAKQTHQWYL